MVTALLPTNGAANVFDSDSFSTDAFSPEAWLFDLAAQATGGGGYVRDFRRHRKHRELEEEAKEVIALIQEASPDDSAAILAEAKEVSSQLQAAIESINAVADAYHEQLSAEQARAEAAALRYLLIDAQLQAERLQQQVEELDMAYIFMMLAVHV